MVSKTMVWRRLVSTCSTRVRLAGSSRPTTTNSTATIAREISSSSKRVIQGSPDLISSRAGTQTGNPNKLSGRGREPECTFRANPPPVGAAGAASGRRRGRPARRERPRRRLFDSSDQLEFEGLEHRPGAVADPQLAQYIGDVVLDRALGHAERIGDLLVGEAAG